MIKVEKITDHPDGTATMALEMTEDELLMLAKIGMMHLIEKAAKEELLDGYIDTEGTEDPDAGPYGGGPVYTDVP